MLSGSPFGFGFRPPTHSSVVPSGSGNAKAFVPLVGVMKMKLGGP